MKETRPIDSWAASFCRGSQWEKTRRLAQPSAHDDDLRVLAYQLMDAAGLQRGQLTRITLSCRTCRSAPE